MIKDVKRAPWGTTERLCGSMGAADCRHPMLGLVLAGYVSDYFQAKTTGPRAWPTPAINSTVCSRVDER